MTWDMEPVSIDTNNAKSPDNATLENSDHNNIDTPIPSDDNVISKPLDPLIMSSKHIRKLTQKLRDITNDIATANLTHEIAYSATISKTTSESIAFNPCTVAEAMRSPDWPKWEEAMYDELKRLKSRQAWDIVDMPADFNTIDSKWVFRTKQDSNGKITGYCTHLVTHGFTQIEGLNYHSDNTYASVTHFPSVRTIPAFASQFNWEIHQVDIKSTYLYGKLKKDENIYLRPPPHIIVSGLKAGQVLKLNIALYGLKQARRR